MMMSQLSSLDWTQGIVIQGSGWFVVMAIVIWLLLGEPLLGRAGFRRLLCALKRGERDIRTRFYRSWTWQAWLLTLLVLALLLGVLGWSPSQLGLRAPHVSVAIPSGFLLGMLVAVPIGIVVGIVMSRRQKKVTSNSSAPATSPSRDVMHMLPRNAGERRAFAMLSITAGITEEVVWRGFGLALLTAVFPHAPLVAGIVVMALAFGWAHLYQGPIGIFSTGMMGAVLTLLYVATGSLLFPIVAHALIDLVAMLRGVPESSPALKT